MPSSPLPSYCKPVWTPEQLVAHLKTRGLLIEDESLAMHVFSTSSYYRFKGYAWAFRQTDKPDKPFYPGTTFEQVWRMQLFDARLRQHVMDAIGTVELAFRTAFNEAMALEHATAFWYQDSALFLNSQEHATALATCTTEFARAGERFADHYRRNYSGPSLPPAWMLIEVTSFGLWSRMYANLRDAADKQAVADCFGLPHAVLRSWIHCLVSIRNICAHHGRLWNRTLGVRPLIPRHAAYPFLQEASRLAAVIMVLATLLKRVCHHTAWVRDMARRVSELPPFRIQQMGFSLPWHAPLWEFIQSLEEAP